MRVWMRTLKEIRLDIHIENIAAQTLNRVVEWQDVYALSIFNVKTLVDIDKVTKLDAKIVTRHLVHLYATFFDLVGAQADEDGIPSLLATEAIRKASNGITKGLVDGPDNDSVPTKQLKYFHCSRVECGD
jgi:hypothetical protein